MYPYFTDITIQEKNRAFYYLMSHKEIAEALPEAKDLDDILRWSWGIQPMTHFNEETHYDTCDFESIPHLSLPLAKSIMEKVARFATQDSCFICMSEETEKEITLFTFRNKNLQVAEFDLTSVLSNDYRNGIAESCLTSLTANPQVLAEIKTEEDVNSLLEDINNSIRSKLTPFLQEKAMQNAAGELPELDLCFKLDGIIHGQELEEYLTENTIPDIEITYRNPEGKSRKLAYDWVEIPVAEKDFSKIYLDNVKSSDGVNNTAMAISDWLEEITKIESIKIKGAEKSHLSVFDIEFMDVDCNIYGPKTKIADKEYTVKNGSFIAKKPDLKQTLGR